MVTAARDAFLTKRVGDVLLLMGVVALCSYSGVMGFNDLYAWAAQAVSYTHLTLPTISCV